MKKKKQSDKIDLNNAYFRVLSVWRRLDAIESWAKEARKHAEEALEELKKKE